LKADEIRGLMVEAGLDAIKIEPREDDRVIFRRYLLGPKHTWRPCASRARSQWAQPVATSCRQWVCR